MPQVSVIIPNYNHSNFLVQRIESVLNQTFQDFEVIIMDDCSTDNSRDIIAQYKEHPKVSQIVLNEENSGSTFKQWEKGVALAKGEYIWLAESDDWCEPSLLWHLAEGINKDPECVMSYCQSYFMSLDNSINYISEHHCLSEVTEGKSYARKRMLLRNPVYNASMVLWKRELFAKISPEFKTYKLVGDWLFWMEIANLGKVHISGRVLNYFRQHENNVSNKNFKSGLNFLETVKVINSLFERKLIDKKDYSKAFRVQFKEFYKIRKKLNPAYSAETLKLFNNPLTSKNILAPMYLSAIWNKVKRFS